MSGPSERYMRSPTLEARFWSKVQKDGPNDCWLWIGARKTGGYGSFMVFCDKRRGIAQFANAHRVSYELVKGPIPSGLTLDHLCRNTSCVNPEHLEAVSMAVNVLRGTGVSAINAAKTHCPKGHPFDLINTGYSTHYKNGRLRYCKTCNRERARRTKELRRVPENSRLHRVNEAWFLSCQLSTDRPKLPDDYAWVIIERLGRLGEWAVIGVLAVVLLRGLWVLVS